MKFWLLLTFFSLFTIYVSAQDDEFKAFTEDTATVQSDEFTTFDESEDTTHVCSHSCEGCPYAQENSSDWSLGSMLMVTTIALSLTLIAGILVRFKTTRNLRTIMLLIGLGFFGFYNGACPCMISSFQNTVLYIAGYDVDWTSLLWFLGLIPLTYVFGRVWCGWVCHLGALQEFLYRPKLNSWLTSEKTGKILKIVRYVLIIALIVQLLIMGSIFWCKIDPFMAIFNIQLNIHYEIISAILLVLLLVSSIFSFRPFCRTVCPVGITLGWISHIPGASIVGLKSKQCISCKSCSEACDIYAITRRRKISYIDNKECIACGDCIEECTKCGLGFLRNNSKNKPVQIFRKWY